MAVIVPTQVYEEGTVMRIVVFRAVVNSGDILECSGSLVGVGLSTGVGGLNPKVVPTGAVAAAPTQLQIDPNLTLGLQKAPVYVLVVGSGTP